MNYQAAKSFDRDGTRYRPGDDLPEGLDKVAIAHYQRHGMIREAPAPGTTKPGGPARSTRQPKGKPEERKPAVPSEHKSAEPSETPEDEAGASAAAPDAPASSASEQAATDAEG